jgi:hypothetical protein
MRRSAFRPFCRFSYFLSLFRKYAFISVAFFPYSFSFLPPALRIIMASEPLRVLAIVSQSVLERASRPFVTGCS